jgi:hypothetical protein
MSPDLFDVETILVTDAARIQSLRLGISSNSHKKAHRRGFRGNPKGRKADAPRADRRELLDDAESVACGRSGTIGDTLNMKKERKELERNRKKWKEFDRFRFGGMAES